VEHLLGREQSLQIGDEKRQTRIVERRQFLVQFRVENGKRPFGLLQLLLGTTDLDFLSFLGTLQSLETVSLSVVIHQLSPSLFNLFLFSPNQSIHQFLDVSFHIADVNFLKFVYSHFRELTLVGVEWDENLVRHFVAKILPKHFNVL
jgi:hypothetical protein